MLGLMLPTWFLSMWISNTATTAMMIPIANAILVQLKETKQAETEVYEVHGNFIEYQKERVMDYGYGVKQYFSDIVTVSFIG